MAYVLAPEPVSGIAQSSILQKSPCDDSKTPTVQVQEISLNNDYEDDDDCVDGTDRCQEILSKALQMQMDIQDSIEALRAGEAERLQILYDSILGLEQSQTVSLLMLGMLNRRVLYDYPSILAEDDSDCDYTVEDPGTFRDEIALLRRTIADVAAAEKKPARNLLHTVSRVRRAQSHVDDLRLALDGLAAKYEQHGESSDTKSALAEIIDDTLQAILSSEEESAAWSETEQGLLGRLYNLSDPVWDVCADMKEMCDLLELNDFDVVKDDFLRKVLDFSLRLPAHWPQATDFRSEIRSDIRSNLGLDKYGQLRWSSC